MRRLIDTLLLPQPHPAPIPHRPTFIYLLPPPHLPSFILHLVIRVHIGDEGIDAAESLPVILGRQKCLNNQLSVRIRRLLQAFLQVSTSNQTTPTRHTGSGRGCDVIKNTNDLTRFFHFVLNHCHSHVGRHGFSITYMTWFYRSGSPIALTRNLVDISDTQRNYQPGTQYTFIHETCWHLFPTW